MQNPSNTLIDGLIVARRVILSVILLDMKTRFGSGYLSYLIAIAWPFSHILFVVGAFSLVNSLSPVGEDSAIFAATGIVPYVLCLYPARTVAQVIITNKSLMSMPIVQPIHLIVARLLLELLSACVVLILCVVICVALDINVIPLDMTIAAQALAATLLLATGLGFLNVALTSIFGPFFVVAFLLIMLLLYLSAGVFVPYWLMPSAMKTLAEYNPLFHMVEWLRAAYFSSYNDAPINKQLVLGTAVTTLMLGLAGERFIRNKMLA